MKVVDEKGFILEGNYLLLYYPVYRTAMLFKIISRVNRGNEEFPPREITYIPPYSFVRYEIPWIDERRTDVERLNMFYYEDANKLLHAFVTIKPVLIKNYLEYPIDVRQGKYLNVTMAPEIADIIGFWRETKELVFLPKIRSRFVSFNSTNLYIKLVAKVSYAEYDVEFIKDADMVKQAWEGKLPVKRITMPIVTESKAFEAKIKGVYGIDIKREFEVI